MRRAALVQGLAFAACLLWAASVAAPTTFTSMPYIANQRVHPFPTMPLPNYYMLDGATVSIEFGFNPGYDQLLLDYDGAFQISTVFSSENGVLYMSGAAPISEYASAIQSVVFTTSSADGANRLITFTFGQNTTYASSTEHFYRYVYSATSSAWSQAVEDCSQRTFMGMQGYLATITSEREMQQVAGRSVNSAWVGASVSANNTWAWKTGPEGLENNAAGRVFWNGGSLYNGGAAPNWLTFDQWYRFRPDGNEDTYAQIVPPMYENVAYLTNTPNTESVDGWICEFGGLDSGAVAATTWSYTSSMLLQFDCELFTTSTDCNNHAAKGCGWSSNTCQTIDCSSHLLQSSCVADWRCDWFVNGEFGVCANTACSQYADAATCAYDSGCQPTNIGGAQHCKVARCSDKTTSCNCAAMDGCSWRSGKCFTTDSLGCVGMDVVYLIDGTVNMSQPFERYPSGFFGLTQSLIDADFALTGTAAGTNVGSSQIGSRFGFVQYGGTVGVSTPSGVGTSSRLSGVRKELEADLKWHQKAYTASITTRTVLSGLTKAVSMLVTSNRKKIIVLVTAGGIDDAASIATSVKAQLAMYSIGLIGVTLRATEPMTADSTAADASLKLLTANTLSTTMTTIGAQVLYGLCGRDPLSIGAFVALPAAAQLCRSYLSSSACSNAGGCLWDPLSGACTQVCASITTYDGCQADYHCAWDPAGRACVASGCMEYCGESTCAADPSCEYNPSEGACYQQCAQLTSSAACNSFTYQTLCKWNPANNYCDTQACIANPNEDACIADTAGCTFNPAVPTQCAETVCVGLSTQIACLSSSKGCAWSNGNCFKNYCNTNSQTTCAAYTQCKWADNACQLTPCGQHTTEMGCNADRSCQWDTSAAPAACSPALCRNFTTAQGCATNSVCYWQPLSENGFQDMCIVKPCSANPRACDCAAQDGCVWKDNLCRDTTFVQCPAMDVVFLIEATSPMSLSFGRHPNGFSGIVEAIRSWSLTAPLSTSILDPGFRLAVVGYGYSKTPLQAPATLGGQNFTANATQFAGIGNILDTFTSLQTTYSANIPTNQNAILQGLQASDELFRTSGSANRQKLLMILGHGAITDGSGTDVPSAVAKLEEQGVQIFSNVIRRFSVITAAENVAAEYLKPLATDPVETHYSFSTIDEMQANLLESFCDPSTTIGTALGVSRDGVLPCNWLTGATECGVQSSCYWNATAAPTCPLPGQCANLGCVALPPALAADFECKHCEYSGGAFSCNRQKNYQPVAGVCLKTPCSSNCASTGCSGSCEWNSDVSSCGRAMCQATDVTTCNADLGCVWVDGTGNGCRRSQCGLMRESTLCTSYTTGSGASLAYPCAWNSQYTPALCVEQRCMYMNAASCALFPANCEYAGNQCSDKLCQFTDAESCSSDVNCVWNPFVRLPGQFGTCQPRLASCQLSDFSSWSPCTANCGANAIRYRSRSIVQFPKPGGASCADVAGSIGLTQVTNCSSEASWQTDCNLYCAQYATSVSQCIADASCQWANMQCAPRPQSGCAVLSTQTACSGSDMCTWDSVINFCTDKPQSCRFDDAATCIQSPGCTWRTGANTNLVAASLSLPSVLVNPGQTKVRVFPTLTLNGNSLLNGATVTIENGYQIGKDILQYTFPSPITSTWMPSSGTLLLSGQASIAEYGNAISSVTFYTSSMRNVARNITWSLGSNTLFSMNSGHYYRYFKQSGVTWDSAKLQCGTSTHFGLVGYLATITTAEENSLVATKLGGDGWLSGDDAIRGGWQWSTGPDVGLQFWFGASSISGGYVAPSRYANWDPMAGEPTLINTGYGHVYLNQSGFWSSRSGVLANSAGYVCEYGGSLSDNPETSFAFGGGVLFGVGGCMPLTACSFHATENMCNADGQCLWAEGGCQVGCGTYSTIAECNVASACTWDTSVLPPVCVINTCKGLGQAACQTEKTCVYQATSGCTLKTGCAQYMTEANCNTQPACGWTGVPGECKPRTCNTLTTQSTCNTNPLCAWSPVTGCSTVLCKYGTSSECQADSQCLWSASDATSASFIPSGDPIKPFAVNTISSPTDMQSFTDGITVFVTRGFQIGDDVLTVDPIDNVAGTFLISWNAQSGVLSLRVAPGVSMRTITAFTFMKNAVKFYSSSPSLIRRTVSFVLALNTVYSPTTNTFLRYNNTYVTSLARAKVVCQQSSLFGMTGRVASITSQTDNLALRSLGASGFITAEYNPSGWWQWSTNTSSAFWQGVGSVGTQLNGAFSSWSFGEPVVGSVSAALNPSGSWKGVPANNVLNYGIICQYDLPPTQVMNGQRSATPSGCSPIPCVGLTQVACAANPQCRYAATAQGSACMLDSFCNVADTVSGCALRELCYWDFNYGSCRSQNPTVCTIFKSSADCGTFSQCSWMTMPSIAPRNSSATGACVTTGCLPLPTPDACTSDPNCRWSQVTAASAGVCMDRSCGYSSSQQCWADGNCKWDSVSSTCRTTTCGSRTPDNCVSDCEVRNSVCVARRCNAVSSRTECLADSACLYSIAKGCFLPATNCIAIEDSTTCSSTPMCYYNLQPNGCVAAQCLSYENQTDCGNQKKSCSWSVRNGGYQCVELAYQSRFAAGSTPGTCNKEVFPTPWWLWTLIAVNLILIGLIIWRVYLAFTQNMTFFSVVRRSAKYDHSQYAAELFDEAQEDAEETNGRNYGRPSLNDL